jgi:[histone H3]-lysine36 N-dimethyltransferase SETMAR
MRNGVCMRIVIARRDIHCGKVMLCVWWNVFGIVHHELLPANRTLNSKTYCEQLDRVEQALIQKHPSLVNRKGVLILQDNARPHVSKETRQKMEQLKWELLPHPPYSPDIAPSDFHLFQSLSHHLANKHYRDRNDIEIDIAEFFMSKPTRFYHDGIYELPKRWQSVVDCRGEYLPD